MDLKQKKNKTKQRFRLREEQRATEAQGERGRGWRSQFPGRMRQQEFGPDQNGDWKMPLSLITHTHKYGHAYTQFHTFCPKALRPLLNMMTKESLNATQSTHKKRVEYPCIFQALSRLQKK